MVGPSTAAAPSPIGARRTQLATGLILFAYVTTHLLNHALGLFGLDAMEDGQRAFVALWRNPVGTIALYGALAAHVALALRSLYRRRQWRMPMRDAAQLLLGLAIPFLLIQHAIGTRLAYEWLGALPYYSRVILDSWEDPVDAAILVVLLTVAWAHGCLGLHFWLRLKPWYPGLVPALAAFAILFPTLALLGFLEALREVGELVRTPGWISSVLASSHAPVGAEHRALEQTKMGVTAGYATILGLTLLARALRNRYERRHQSIRVFYPGGRQVRAPIGFTVLEVSRFGGIPHASVCGGRGRCSTCRVRVESGLQDLPQPSPAEAAVLKRVGAAADVRLACQLRPTGDLTVTPLLSAGASTQRDADAPAYLQGDEREVCILFADLRGFTRFAERKLPYDVVFFLNRYFATMGAAIERSGGTANQFTGDGVMALFGVESGPEQGCRDAIRAAQAMSSDIAEMSRDLAGEMDEPLRMGIGIHVGPAVVGRMGYGVAMYLTAVGDTVHVASRLQDLTKQYQCQLVISDQAAAMAGIKVADFPQHEITVRNRAEPISIRTVDDVRNLALTPAPGG